MDTALEKLQNLRTSVQKLETVLQEVWSLIDEIGEDQSFMELMNTAKKNKKQKHDDRIEQLILSLNEFDETMGEIPEDGTAAVDFEDAISELIDWIKNNSYTKNA